MFRFFCQFFCTKFEKVIVSAQKKSALECLGLVCVAVIAYCIFVLQAYLNVYCYVFVIYGAILLCWGDHFVAVISDCSNHFLTFLQSLLVGKGPGSLFYLLTIVLLRKRNSIFNQPSSVQTCDQVL